MHWRHALSQSRGAPWSPVKLIYPLARVVYRMFAHSGPCRPPFRSSRKSGRHAPDSVDGIHRIHWSTWIGLRTPEPLFWGKSPPGMLPPLLQLALLMVGFLRNNLTRFVFFVILNLEVNYRDQDSGSARVRQCI